MNERRAIHQVTAGTHCRFAVPLNTFFLAAIIENVTFQTSAAYQEQTCVWCTPDFSFFITQHKLRGLRGHASMCNGSVSNPFCTGLMLVRESPPPLAKRSSSCPPYSDSHLKKFNGSAPTPQRPTGRKISLGCSLRPNI